MYKRLVLSVLAWFVLAAGGRADIPGPDGKAHPHPWGWGVPPPGWHPDPPPRPPAEPAPIPISVEPPAPGEKQTRLRLPASLGKNLRADDARRAWAPSAGSTLIAGAGMSIALALGGLWLSRFRRRRWIGAAAVVVAVVAVVGVSGCPWDRQYTTYDATLLPPVLRDDGTLGGDALLESDDKTDAIHLVIDPDKLAELAAKPATDPLPPPFPPPSRP